MEIDSVENKLPTSKSHQISNSQIDEKNFWQMLNTKGKPKILVKEIFSFA